MNAEVKQAVHACDICKTADKSTRTATTPLQPVPLPDRPWSKVGIDIVGPFERAPPAYRYVITLVDYFSKWPEVQFCSSVTTKTVTNFLHLVFTREGYPDSLVCDNGPQFVSEEFKTFLAHRGIKHKLVSNYHPQANGQVERFNRTLKSYIQCAALENRALHAAVLDYLFVYRCTPHATTGLSPALLLHGRKPRHRLHVLGLSYTEFLKNPFEEMQRLRERVQQRQDHSRRYTDGRRAARTPRFRVGDLVRVKKPGKVPKGTNTQRLGSWSVS